MIATVKIINYPFSMNYCFVKASQSYKNLLNMALKVLSISIPFPEGFEITVWHKSLLQILFYGMWIRRRQRNKADNIIQILNLKNKCSFI